MKHLKFIPILLLSFLSFSQDESVKDEPISWLNLGYSSISDTEGDVDVDYAGVQVSAFSYIPDTSTYWGLDYKTGTADDIYDSGISFSDIEGTRFSGYLGYAFNPLSEGSWGVGLGFLNNEILIGNARGTTYYYGYFITTTITNAQSLTNALEVFGEYRKEATDDISFYIRGSLLNGTTEFNVDGLVDESVSDFLLSAGVKVNLAENFFASGEFISTDGVSGFGLGVGFRF
jgi:hypothetical protein